MCPFDRMTMTKKKNQVKALALNTDSVCGPLELYAGSVILSRRKSMGLSGKELGKRVGLSQQQVSRYERGKTSLTLSQLVCFSVALDMSLLQFINELFLCAELNEIWGKDNEPPSLNYPDDISVDIITNEVLESALIFNQDK